MDNVQDVSTQPAPVQYTALAQFALIQVSGEDAAAFLQGQLSSDVRALDGTSAQYATYSTAKGRMLANFLLYKQGDSYRLLLPAELVEPISRRLRMFVLRSKVVIESLALTPALLLGEGVLALLNRIGWPAPLQPMQCAAGDGVMLVSLPGCGVLVVAEDGESCRKTFAEAGATEVSAQAGELAFIRAGFAWVRLPTQEAYVPQMANMEIVGAINFRKGCYPGQEIVARMQYLGKSKRRLYRVAANGGELKLGADVFDAQQPDNVVGSVAAVAELPDGTQEALLVTLISAWDNGVVAAMGGETLRRLNLPYSVDVD